MIDMTGTAWGRLSVLRRADTPRGRGYEAMWMCLCDCGSTAAVGGHALRSGATQSCGCYRLEKLRDRNRSMRGEDSPAWRGGRYTAKGYRQVRAEGHPNANRNGYVAEHVAVMSEHMGRPLLKGETVHHRNGIRDDNRIENLELWSSSHPPGQRVSDKIRWCREFLSAYGGSSDWSPDSRFLRGRRFAA